MRAFEGYRRKALFSSPKRQAVGSNPAGCAIRIAFPSWEGYPDVIYRGFGYMAAVANERSVSPVGLSAKRKRLEFVSAKGRMKPAPRDPGDH